MSQDKSTIRLVGQLVKAYHSKLRTDLTTKASALAAPVRKGSGWGSAWLQAREDLLGKTELKNPVAQHVWVFACVTKIARNLGTVPMMIYRGDDVVTPRMRDGYVNQLFRKAEPRLVGSALFERTVDDMLQRGAAYWLPIFNKFGKPASFYCLQSRYVLPRIGPEGKLLGWTYAGQINFGPNELIQLPFFQLGDGFTALGPLEVARTVAETDYKAMMWLNSTFDNQAEPGGVLSTDQELDGEYVSQLSNRWEARHQGLSKAKRIAVLDQGLKYEKIALSAEELEYLGLRRFTREDICAAFGVPQALLGVTDDVNYATHRSLKRIFWEDTVYPLLVRLQDVIQARVFDVWFPEMTCRFDLKEILELQRDIPQEIGSARKLFEMGFTANELNDWFRWGFETEEWRNEPYVMANLLDRNARANAQDPGRPANPDPDEAGDGSQGGEAPAEYDSLDAELIKATCAALQPALKRGFFELRCKTLRGDRVTPDEMVRELGQSVAKLFGMAGMTKHVPLASHLLVKAVRQIDKLLTDADEATIRQVFNTASNRTGKLVKAIEDAILEAENGQEHEEAARH